MFSIKVVESRLSCFRCYDWCSHVTDIISNCKRLYYNFLLSVSNIGLFSEYPSVMPSSRRSLAMWGVTITPMPPLNQLVAFISQMSSSRSLIIFSSCYHLSACGVTSDRYYFIVVVSYMEYLTKRVGEFVGGYFHKEILRYLAKRS